MKKYKYCEQCRKEFDITEDECGFFGHQKLSSRTYTMLEIEQLFLSNNSLKEDLTEKPKKIVKICPECKTENHPDARSCINDNVFLLNVKSEKILVKDIKKSFQIKIKELIYKYSLGVEETLIFGRNFSNKINDLEENINISRSHFSIIFDGFNFYISDIGSKNGTKINSLKVLPNSKHVLNNQDLISVANLEMVFIC